MDYDGYTNQRLYHRIPEHSTLNSSIRRHTVSKTQRVNSNFNNSMSQANFERANWLNPRETVYVPLVYIRTAMKLSFLPW